MENQHIALRFYQGVFFVGYECKATVCFMVSEHRLKLGW